MNIMDKHIVLIKQTARFDFDHEVISNWIIMASFII